MFYRLRRNKKGFTLVELIVVIAIIAILSTVAGIAIAGAVDNSRKSSVQSSASTLSTVLLTGMTQDDSQTVSTCLSNSLNGVKEVYYNQKAGTAKLSECKGADFAIKNGKWWCVVHIQANGNTKVDDPTDTTPSGFSDTKKITL